MFSTCCLSGPRPSSGEVDRLCISSAATAAIAASPALNGIVRLAIKLVEHHGKSGCDGNSNTPVFALKHAIEPVSYTHLTLPTN